jgi:dUTP pyrophosphatase
MRSLKIQKVRDVKTPTRANADDAGIDFFIPNDIVWESHTMLPGEGILIPSGIVADIPEDFALICLEKSGVATKRGLIVGAKVVDSGYTGEIHIHLINTSREVVTIRRGEKIVQFLLLPIASFPIEIVGKIGVKSPRGSGGFGSTGTE